MRPALSVSISYNLLTKTLTAKLFPYMEFEIVVASEQHVQYAETISAMIREASEKRGTGIATRTTEYIALKLKSGNAIIALHENEVAGFCYIETWSHHKYVANSGLIVDERYRHHGLAANIKKRAFELSQKLYPEAKLFGITTSLPVMKINSMLGYKPVTFSELTDDETFWKGCQGCKNHDILLRNEHKMCLCTGMLYEPKTIGPSSPEPKKKRWERFMAFLQERSKRTKKLKLENYEQ
jgi:hypothetical protein